MISFIVPAYNEEALIGATLEAIHKSAHSVFEPYEIIVADDHSTDTTAAIARSNGARVIELKRRQIAAARNAGAREAAGDKLIFVDADTVVNEAVVRAASEAAAFCFARGRLLRPPADSMKSYSHPRRSR
jgi:glycosyltransferase involved in cell wall biosynthesis